MKDTRYKSPSRIGLAVVLAFALMMFSSLARAGVNVTGMNFVDKIMDQKQVTKAEGDSVDSMERSVIFVNVIVQAVLAALFIVWMRRCHLNLWDLNARQVRNPTFACVAAWFIPLVSLVWPYFIMSEIWKASNPEATDQEQWKLSKVPPYLWLWWLFFALYVFGGVFSNMLAKAVDKTNPPDLQVLSSFYFVSFLDQLLSVCAAGLGIIVVQRLTKRQEEKYLILLRAQADGESEST